MEVTPGWTGTVRIGPIRTVGCPTCQVVNYC